MGYSVRNIPNVPSLRALFKSLSRTADVVCGYRPRGRGLPVGKTWDDVQYGTPLCEAPKFTAYYGGSPYVYLEFVDVREDGTPHLRLLS